MKKHLQVDGICEFCFRAFIVKDDGYIPDGWDVVFGCYVCPECLVRVSKDGGFGEVLGGSYAYSEDPRSREGAWK